MKKTLTLILFILVRQICFGQNCNDFSDNKNVTNWRGYEIAGISFQKNGTRGNYLEFVDGSGSSYVVNDKEFGGNWLTKGANGCLCFDYSVDWNDAVSTPGVKGPKIGIYGGTPIANDLGSKIRAGFTGNPQNPDLKDNNWTKFCLPVGLSANGQLPSNSYGSWSIANGSTILTGAAACAAWDNLIQNVTGIYLFADYNAQPSEIVRFDNFCWTCITDSQQTNCGCPNTTNLIKNGDFENGITGFISQFDPMNQKSKAFLPGVYTVGTFSNAIEFCKNWNSAACGRDAISPNKFLLVNGATGQPGLKSVWSQDVQLEAGKEYKLCMLLRNLPQCCFNVLPKITISYFDGVKQQSLPSFTVTESACPGFRFSTKIVIPAGPTASIKSTISIHLDQTALGDGNDLAIDDISLIRLDRLPAGTVLITPNISTNILNSTDYTVSVPVTSNPVLPTGSLIYWSVVELDNTDNEISGTKVETPNASWQSVPGTFPGYNGTSSTSGSTPGIFKFHKKYKVTFAVAGECFSRTSAGYILQLDPSSRKARFIPVSK